MMSSRPEIAAVAGELVADETKATEDAVVETDAPVGLTRPDAGRSRFARSRVLRRLSRNRAMKISLAFILLLVLVAIFANVVAPRDPNAQDLSSRLQGPGSQYWLGSDALGRDLLSRVIVATRVTLLAAMQGLGIALLLGVPLGLLAGYVGKWTDALLSRLSDGLLALPPLILAMGIVGMLGAGLTNAMVAVGVVMAPRFFRITRAAAQSTSHEAYVEACRAGGASNWRILWRHVLPNSSGPLLVQVSFGIGLVITSEASLSFLGLGVQAPQASWGSMVRDGFDQMRATSWTIVPPTVCFVLTVLAFFILGDCLRDALGRGSDDRR